ncbi:MAG: hypothetical protein JRE64_00505 [Deltaproteobacteria bacterium]|nr:hypothetical protein [Deltaproteobacteria bacterium]
MSKESKLPLLDALIETDIASGQSNNYVVNVAALIKCRDQIEKLTGSEVSDEDLFGVLSKLVMNGGVIVMTDESTTGQAISVDFSKKVVF